MYNKALQIHFVGIGGIGMSGIAEVLLNLGYRVSGSDVRETAITRRLTELGGTIFLGHRGESVTGADVVVISSAIGQDNVEVLAARRLQIPVIPRAAMLAELMRMKNFGIAVAGSHGKTSTTSMVGWVLASAGLDPTIVIGGQVNSIGSNALLGSGEFLVAEADESDGSFLHLAPVIDVVTNIDLEHVDFYRDIEQLKDVFVDFLTKIPFYGAAILCIDDPNVAAILPRLEKRIVTYGLSGQADVAARNIRYQGLQSRFVVYHQGARLGEVILSQPGRHNVANALAAIAVALELGISFGTIGEALAAYSGVQRRLQIKGECRGITVIDDYGHHPTEIRATLAALRTAWPERRLVVLFQPHRFSRTQGLFDDFCTAFHDADRLLVTDIYPAGEQPIAEISGAALVDGIALHGHRRAEYAGPLEQVVATVLPILQPGDLVCTLGAGNINRLGEELLAGLDAAGAGAAGGCMT